jgi:hypothetical protein
MSDSTDCIGWRERSTPFLGQRGWGHCDRRPRWRDSPWVRDREEPGEDTPGEDGWRGDRDEGRASGNPHHRCGDCDHAERDLGHAEVGCDAPDRGGEGHGRGASGIWYGERYRRERAGGLRRSPEDRAPGRACFDSRLDHDERPGLQGEGREVTITGATVDKVLPATLADVTKGSKVLVQAVRTKTGVLVATEIIVLPGNSAFQ